MIGLFDKVVNMKPRNTFGRLTLVTHNPSLSDQTPGAPLTQNTAGTHRAQNEALTAAATELMTALTAGEVETTPFGQAEDQLAVWTL